ncbi:hypothetical protein CWI42_010170 [Ordospora colligata]|uniref:Uncharacterized protein n=1 Tax=Ordospora colligata OC4 TaxID=1354746 RepID=A0A0B2UH27_9MICR|nr:uncharacterized protein M896_010170 [Ordospora colligata OC4]KHN70366.1 hypothetical protein M896_010170 [Ordospora colligata OC4]TBU17116.1 hypothetical protein CWI41_010170 [Ordospora colligata]TBU17366.1 hypothetical protein CWI40_010170 [Ordospora colligata]TBU19546.1 hypothetical protein CWI42_010170 [Ordospora colligata]
MQVLTEEFEKISVKHKHQKLHTKGFSPEQIYYQIEDLCLHILQASESAITDLGLIYENTPQQIDHKCNCKDIQQDCSIYSHNNVASSTPNFIQDEDSSTSTSDQINENSLSETSLDSDDFGISREDISHMAAEDLIKILDSKARRTSNHYINDSDSSEDDSQQK